MLAHAAHRSAAGGEVSRAFPVHHPANRFRFGAMGAVRGAPANPSLSVMPGAASRTVSPTASRQPGERWGVGWPVTVGSRDLVRRARAIRFAAPFADPEELVNLQKWVIPDCCFLRR